jgi:hypothetical protein
MMAILVFPIAPLKMAMIIITMLYKWNHRAPLGFNIHSQLQRMPPIAKGVHDPSVGAF